MPVRGPDPRKGWGGTEGPRVERVTCQDKPGWEPAEGCMAAWLALLPEPDVNDRELTKGLAGAGVRLIFYLYSQNQNCLIPPCPCPHLQEASRLAQFSSMVTGLSSLSLSHFLPYILHLCLCHFRSRAPEKVNPDGGSLQ